MNDNHLYVFSNEEMTIGLFYVKQYVFITIFWKSEVCENHMSMYYKKIFHESISQKRTLSVTANE